MESGGRGTAPKYLLRDRDKIFGKLFQDRVGSIGIEEVLTAYRSPWQNAHVERLNGSIRRQCTDHIIVWDERHLKTFFRSISTTKMMIELTWASIRSRQLVVRLPKRLRYLIV
ncbi:MAG: hypothetical protein ACJAVI_001916 [Candidatus Azotimanducaceae bacterium]|jgi:hypothetical protein